MKRPVARPRPARARPAAFERHRAWINPWWSPSGRTGSGIRMFWRELTAVQMFVASFALMIVLGTIGLKLIPGLYAGSELGWLDALFTATSAVCVTGLIVVDTATYFTVPGQAFILLLIQAGGLGMITFASVVIMGLGGRLSLRQEEFHASHAGVAPHIDFRNLTRNVLRFTLALEAAGALILWLLWGARLGWGDAVWHAVFHAVSAFCNAGFSTFSDSLVSLQQAPLTLFVIMLLIVAGGLGFLTLQELDLMRRPAWRIQLRGLSLHSRLALTVSAALLLTAWPVFVLFEWTGSLDGMPIWAKLLNGLFMSVTPRTAGFNSVDYSQVTQSSAFLTVLLMFVGGSPGGTAGGVKTTTFALVGLLAWARLRGRPDVSAWGRTVPEETVNRSIGLFVAAFSIVTAAIFLFTAAGLAPAARGGQGDFLARMFEATSAFGTVGLSMGVTDDLTASGRWITIVLMFLGRLGPLALAAAIALPGRRHSRFRYAHEDVMVG